MKLGVQTVVWGNRISSLEAILDMIAEYGFQGVEISQCPEQLGDPGELKEMLARRNLTLIGLSGGTLRDRIAYCGSLIRPEYLYIDQWNEAECREALNAGFQLALHPLGFDTVRRLATVGRLLEQYPELLFLPDTAHLTIAGDSPAEAVMKWRNRLAAVNLMDWTPVYGRSSHRYARGFTELGQGIVAFDALFDRLHKISYKGWLIVEQGSPGSPPQQVLRHAASWLSRRSQPMSLRTNTVASAILSPSQVAAICDDKYSLCPIPAYSSEEEKRFLETALRIASADSHHCYSRLAEAIGRLLKADLVTLCACTPTADVISVMGVHPATTELGTHFVSYSGSLSGVAMGRQSVTEFDLQEECPGAPYHQPNARLGIPSLITQHGLRRLVSVPLLNPDNPRQARLVLNIFLRSTTHSYNVDDLLRFGQIIAQAADSALDQRCAMAAAITNFVAGRCEQASAFLEQLRDLLLDVIRCKALSIFLVNDSSNRLELAVTTGLNWRVLPPEQFYSCGEGLTGQVWESRELLLTSNPMLESGVIGKSDETGARSSLSLLLAPMLDVRGEVVGVVRCRNKHSNPDGSAMFSEDDVAVLDAVCQGAVPHLQALLNKERRAKALRRLTHELSNPLCAIRDVAVLMRRELERSGQSTENLFPRDYLNDLDGWISLMRRLVGNADFFRLTTHEMTLNQRRHYLSKDIFMPVIGQAQLLLEDRGYASGNISVEHFEEIPPLWLDGNLMHQVVFNLLTNAIKYAESDPDAFRVTIVAKRDTHMYVIDFCDWGQGVEENMKEAIFKEGVRGTDAKHRNVAGDGLGLWIARRVLAQHGAEITLTEFRKPTIFTISLPKSLSTPPQRK